MSDYPEGWRDITHTADLRCAKGYVLRKRDWGEHGKAGCFTATCPNPDCAIPARQIGRGKVK